MTRARVILFLIPVGIVIIGLYLSAFIVNERQRGLVLQFGQFVAEKEDPGLYFKVPFIQEVVYYDKRIQGLATRELEVILRDNRRLVVVAFARWRISDARLLRQEVTTLETAQIRLGDIIVAELREVLGANTSEDVLSERRTDLMDQIAVSVREEAANFGIEIVDVRIQSADLPEQNLEATFDRMIAERQREAIDERARGQERKVELESLAQREAAELRAGARRRAAIVIGLAEGEATKIFAEAYGGDAEEFYEFYGELKTCEQAIRSNSFLVISPGTDVCELLAGLSNDTGR